MGTNHARTIAESPRAVLAGIIDPALGKAVDLASQYGTKSSSELDLAYECQGVVIASPTETHEHLASGLIEAGVPVLIEKPIATDPVAISKLLDRAETLGVPVMCGFVERFNPVVAAALHLVDDTPTHILAIRHSPPAPRIVTSAVYDLLIHDIDLILRFSDTSILHSHGSTISKGGVVEVADCSIQFSNGCLATASSSRLGQHKVRSMSITTPTMTIDLDLLRQDITVYRHVNHVLTKERSYQAQTIIDIPFVKTTGEPLALQLDYFIDIIMGIRDPNLERNTLLEAHMVADLVSRNQSVELSEHNSSLSFSYNE